MITFRGRPSPVRARHHPFITHSERAKERSRSLIRSREAGPWCVTGVEGGPLRSCKIDSAPLMRPPIGPTVLITAASMSMRMRPARITGPPSEGALAMSAWLAPVHDGE